MSPLWWLALPVVVTTIGAMILVGRSIRRRHEDPHQRRQRDLDRLRRALHKPGPGPAPRRDPG